MVLNGLVIHLYVTNNKVVLGKFAQDSQVDKL